MKKTASLILALVLVLSVSIPAASAATNIYPVDAGQSAYKNEILSVYGYGGLNGLVDTEGNFNPNADCSTKDFATMLANMFGTKYISPSNYGSWTITQGVACDLMTGVSRQLGHGVTFNNVTSNATVNRGTACALIVIMLNSNSALKGVIVGNNGSSLPGCSSPSYVYPFVDVPTNAWYANAVTWAANKGITCGTSATTFSPNDSITIAQMYCMLWRTQGCPTVRNDCPFGGVETSNYYYQALCWAGAKGLVSNDRIDPFATPASRADMTWCLWQLAGAPYVGGKLNFNDVSSGASYATAIRWAVRNGVAGGTSSSTFEPLGALSRAATVTMLYNRYG